MARLGKSDFVKGERMSWLEGYVKEFPDSTPEDIIWAWMNKNHQATIGDEKILFVQSPPKNLLQLTDFAYFCIQ